jgi:hypothetical protein
MNRFTLSVAAFLIAVSVAHGQVTVVTPPLQDGVYVLRVANGQATLTNAVVPNIGPVVTPPIVTPPVNPPQTDLKQVASSAIAAVPTYADKDTNIKQLAFALNMVTGSIANSPKPQAEGIALIKGLFDSIAKGNATQWAGFWTAVTPHLNACTTNAQLATAFGTIQQALADAVPDSADETETFGEFPTYGLQADGANGEWLRFIMEMLPIILEIIKLFAVL